MIINYDRNHSFIVLATVITIVNYDRKTFIIHATYKHSRSPHNFSLRFFLFVLSDGWIQTLDLRIKNRGLYPCAPASGIL